MKYVKLAFVKPSFYKYRGGNSIGMDILAFFLSDIGCDLDCIGRFKNWALADNSNRLFDIGTNTAFLEDLDNGYMYIMDGTGGSSEETPPDKLMLSKQQFFQLLNDWEEKVCKLKPKEVIIKHENDQFVIETSD